MISKPQLFRVHKWCGLVACTLLAIQAVTGILEAYGDDIEQLADPLGMLRHTPGNNVPLADVVQVLRRTYPTQAAERIVFPKYPDGTYFVHLVNAAGDKTYVSIDPGDAQVLRSGHIWTFPAEAAARIHYDYISGTPGMAIVAIAGFLGLSMAVTGISFWWPRPGRRAQQLRINWRGPGKFILRQLHRSTGVLMALFLGFSLVTGLTLAIYYFEVSAGAPPGTNVPAPLPDGWDIDSAIRRASGQYPGHDIRDIRFVGTDRVDVYFNAPERNPRAAHQVSFDVQSGAITGTLDAQANTALWVTWLPLHSGESFGVSGKALVTANALVLLGLAFSGPIMWFNRVRLRRRKNRHRGKTAPP